MEIDGTIYKTLYTTKFANKKKYEAKNEKQMLSVLPGTIMKVDINVGEKVTTGQPLLVFEAMKMLNTFKSPMNGVIKNIHIKPGDKISKNFLMLEFE